MANRSLPENLYPSKKVHNALQGQGDATLCESAPKHTLCTQYGPRPTQGSGASVTAKWSCPSGNSQRCHSTHTPAPAALVSLRTQPSSAPDVHRYPHPPCSEAFLPGCVCPAPKCLSFWVPTRNRSTLFCKQSSDTEIPKVDLQYLEESKTFKFFVLSKGLLLELCGGGGGSCPRLPGPCRGHSHGGWKEEALWTHKPSPSTLPAFATARLRAPSLLSYLWEPGSFFTLQRMPLVKGSFVIMG